MKSTYCVTSETLQACACQQYFDFVHSFRKLIEKISVLSFELCCMFDIGFLTENYEGIETAWFLLLYT